MKTFLPPSCLLYDNHRRPSQFYVRRRAAQKRVQVGHGMLQGCLRRPKVAAWSPTEHQILAKRAKYYATFGC
ncbi:hypothetical protein E2C01_023870 [Portunus trituberculatus]|uniref:Uncharacterized protein n=1 Tax=Portunus trituberculatus TaxID=210409 RepID=A0A5B7ECC0_PORTR|nr:hypothetical protein [Portunus trituberculatus]